MRRKVRDRMLVRLTDAIQKWADHEVEAELDDWMELLYLGEGSVSLAATAAMAVLENGDISQEAAKAAEG